MNSGEEAVKASPDLASERTRGGVLGTAVSARPRIFVVGFGNPLRSDDGIGWRVAKEMQSRVKTPHVEVIQCFQLAPELAEKLRDAAVVVFIDAAGNSTPGKWTHQRVTSANSHAAFTHAPTPSELLALTGDLYGASPEAHLFTVCGGSFGYNETLSPEVEGVLPSIVAEIEAFLRTAESALLAG